MDAIFYNDNFLIAVYIIPLIIQTYGNFIPTIVCIDYQRKYILNFMNKINFDFENNKIDYKWNAANLFNFLFNYESSREKRNFNNVKISVYNRTDNNPSSERKAKEVVYTDDKIIDLKEKIDELNSDKKFNQRKKDFIKKN